MRQKPARNGRFYGVKLLPFGLLLLLAGLARPFRGFGRNLTLDNGMLVMITVLLLALLLVGVALLLTRWRR